MIYYSIWPNQGTLCFSVCTFNPQKVIYILILSSDILFGHFPIKANLSEPLQSDLNAVKNGLHASMKAYKFAAKNFFYKTCSVWYVT